MPSRKLARYFPTITCCALAACGGAASRGTTGGSTTDLRAAAPIMAIASPVASRSSTGIQAQALRSSALAVAADAPANGAGATGQELSLPAQIAAINDRLAKTTVAECLQGIQLQPSEGHASCYGPSLAFVNHPDAVLAAGPVFDNSSWCPTYEAGNAADGCLPSGDLGIWSPTEPGTGEACTAATMNAQLMSAASVVNSSVTLMAGLICVAQVNEADLAPGAGALDLHDTLDQNLEGATFTTASLQRLPDGDGGRATYRIAIAGTVGTTPVDIVAVHSPGSDAAGLMNGYLDKVDGMYDTSYRKAFSLLYQVEAGKLRYELRSGNTTVEVERAELFAEDGTFDFVRQVQRENGAGMAGGGIYERAEIDGTTGLGSLIHAWQAGNGDHFTRVFHASTSADAAGGPDTGFGYFGNGSSLDSPTVGDMIGLACNWAGPGAQQHWVNGAPNLDTENVQAQTMARDAATGRFVPVGEDHISYAPTRSCNASAADGFRYQALGNAPGTPTRAEVEALAAAGVTNTLVPKDSPSIGVMPEVPPPAPYTPAP